MRKTIACSACAVVTVLLLSLLSGCSQEREEVDAPELATGGPRTIHVADGYWVGLIHEAGTKQLGISRRERDPSTGIEYHSHIAERVSYALQRVDHRHAEEIYVMGVARDGQEVIERWDLVSDTGAYASSRPTANMHFGVPAPVGTTQNFIIGGTFVEPSQREPPRVEREELYHGTGLGGFRSVAIDPEGRFMLVLSEQTSKILSLWFQASPVTPTEITTPAEFPYLTQATSIEVADHTTEGRVYIVTNHGGVDDGVRILLHDGDNNGDFENREQLPQALWESRGYVDDNAWVSDFIHYP